MNGLKKYATNCVTRPQIKTNGVCELAFCKIQAVLFAAESARARLLKRENSPFPREHAAFLIYKSAKRPRHRKQTGAESRLLPLAIPATSRTQDDGSMQHAQRTPLAE